MQKRMGWMVVGMIALASTTASAAVPSEFTVQGVLRDSGGALQTMPLTITVDFYNVQTAGSPLNAAPYVANSVPVTNGLFTQTFTLTGGDLTNLSNALAVWMAVQAGTDTFPRQKVTPELYALIAKSAENADGLSASCSGCVDNAKIAASGINGDKITTGTVAASATTNALAGRTVVAGSPVAGSGLVWNNGASRWEAGPVVSSVTAGTGLTGGTITSTGTIGLSVPVSVANGGTGSTTQNFVDLSNNQFNVGGIKGFASTVFVGPSPAPLPNPLPAMFINSAGGANGHIQWDNLGVAPPGPTSAGWKLQTWTQLGIPEIYGMGIDSSTQWYSSGSAHDFYSVLPGPVWTLDARIEPGKLTVRKDAPGALGPTLTLFNGSGGGNAACNIDFDVNDPGANAVPARIGGIDNGNFSADLVFSTKNPGAITNALVERVRIQGGGTVSVGSNNPLPQGLLYVNQAASSHTTAVFGSVQPVTIVQSVPSIGFNTYFDNNWKVVTASAFTALIALESGTGDLLVSNGNNPTPTGSRSTGSASLPTSSGTPVTAIISSIRPTAPREPGPTRRP